MRVRAAVLLLAMVASGCSDGGGAGGQPGPSGDGGPGQGGATGLQAPSWAIGDWWQYGVESSAGGESPPTTYVVAEDQGGDWWMATDSPERAFQDARSDISRLGPQRKADLAGSQGTDRVEFFQWPLAAGGNWTTKWDGEAVTVSVEEADAGGATLSARNATHLAYTYTYDAEARWFGTLNRHAPDGSVAFSLLLLDWGGNWTGTLASWELAEMHGARQDPGPVNFGLNGFPRLPVPPGTTDLWVDYLLPCEGQGGGYTLRLQPDDPQSGDAAYDDSGQCNAPVAFTGVAVVAPASPTWTLLYTWGSAPVQDGLRVEVLARKLVETPFP